MLINAIIALLILFNACMAQGETLQIQISSPKDEQQVPERTMIKGTVNDNKVEVRVVIHPMEVGDYWVQPSVTVKEDGTWKVLSYIGRPGGVDIGKSYEIMAFAKPEEKLKEGMKLPNWPKAQAKSHVVDVTRK